MIELNHNSLLFSFPDVHPYAKFSISFQRTLRIPDDGKHYSLPPGLGSFPLCHVDDFADSTPPEWLEHGGVMFPMYQSEAMWINLKSVNLFYRFHKNSYPFIVKVAAGKIDAITGQAWTDRVRRNPQDYMVIPEQPWLDGYCVEQGLIRQFVAMPLGSGYTAEEQITAKAEHGGLQIVVYPMKAEAYNELFSKSSSTLCRARFAICGQSMAIGLAPGGLMQQEIYEDPYDFDVWDLDHKSRCFVHIANSIAWRAITGKIPPTLPPTAEQYNSLGLPWFQYYNDDLNALTGSENLKNLQSVAQLSQQKKKVVLPENKPIEEKLVHKIIHSKKGLVREGRF